MKKRTKVILLILFSVCLAAAFIAGCGEMTKEEYLKKNNATDQSVTYFGNGGRFNDKDRYDIELNYKAGSYILTANDNPNFNIARTNYTFVAWYYTNVDDEGNLLLDDDGEPFYGEKLGEREVIEEGQHLYVIAGWLKNVAIDVVLVTDGFDVTDADGTVYKSGEVVNELAFGSTVVYGLSEKSVGFTAQNATYLYFFSDEECTTPINSVVRPEGNGDNIRVYAKYLKGNYTIVSNAEGVRKMFQSYEGNFYLFTPDGSNVINCDEGTRKILMNDGNSAYNIEGNGVTLENLSFTQTGISTGEYSILGNLTSDTCIKNLIISNLSVTATVASGTVEIYLFCNAVQEGAVIENVTIRSASLEIGGPKNSLNVINIELADGSYKTDNWLFGGFDTDDEFLAEYGPVVIDGASLTCKTVLADNISK